DVNVNGTWRQLLGQRDVDSGMVVPLGGVEMVAIPDGDFLIQVTGFEVDDWPEKFVAGGTGVAAALDDRGPAGARLGPNLLIGGQDWILHYTVLAGGSLPAVLGTPNPETGSPVATFWGPRLAEEPNHEVPVDLPELPVPLPGQPPIEMLHLGYVTEPAVASPTSPLDGYGGAVVFGTDVDVYRFTLADFADLSIGNLPTGV